MHSRDLRAALRPARLPTTAGEQWRAFELGFHPTYSLAKFTTFVLGEHKSWAYPRWHTGPAGRLETQFDDDVLFEVQDCFGLTGDLGRGSNQWPSPHSQGSTGFARRSPESGLWQIMAIDPAAELIRGFVQSCPDEFSFRLWPYDVLTPRHGLIVHVDPGQPISVWNESKGYSRDFHPQPGDFAYACLTEHGDPTWCWEALLTLPLQGNLQR